MKTFYVLPSLLIALLMPSVSIHGQAGKQADSTAGDHQGPAVPGWALKRDGTVVPEWKEPGKTKLKGPPPAGLYVSMGDSITFGYGTSKPCQSFPTHPIDVDEFCPGGTSYAVRVAKGLRDAGLAGHFMNLGISGADIPRMMRDELPFLPEDATLITIYIGTNDSRAAARSSAEGVVQRFEKGFDELLSAVHAKAPHSRVILMNFPNERVLAEMLAETYKTPAEALPKYETVSAQLAAFIDSHFPEYPVVDTVCMPESYQEDLLFKKSVHPNDQGSAVLAKAVLKVILSAAPQPPPHSCNWLTSSQTSSDTK